MGKRHASTRQRRVRQLYDILQHEPAVAAAVMPFMTPGEGFPATANCPDKEPVLYLQCPRATRRLRQSQCKQPVPVFRLLRDVFSVDLQQAKLTSPVSCLVLEIRESRIYRTAIEGYKLQQGGSGQDAEGRTYLLPAYGNAPRLFHIQPSRQVGVFTQSAWPHAQGVCRD